VKTGSKKIVGCMVAPVISVAACGWPRRSGYLGYPISGVIGAPQEVTR
jgi:hypothetical protein